MTQETFWFANCNSLAMEEVVTPLPRPDITPPVTKMNFVCTLMKWVRGFCMFGRSIPFGFYFYKRKTIVKYGFITWILAPMFDEREEL